jgi:RNA polymerase sigma-70 factor (ECF subfamily)
MREETVWERIELLYRSRFAAFVRVARAITADRESALEAVQEGFADALRGADGWQGRGSLEGYVFRCVVNRSRKMRRRGSGALEHSVGFGPTGDADLSELRVRIAGLPERQRLVVFLRYYADLEYREIAAALGIETGTVSATLSAAHAALRKSMAEVEA